MVILGTAIEVAGPSEKLKALKAMMEHILSGRWEDARTKRELQATLVLSPLMEGALAKTRLDPPPGPVKYPYGLHPRPPYLIPA